MGSFRAPVVCIRVVYKNKVNVVEHKNNTAAAAGRHLRGHDNTAAKTATRAGRRSSHDFYIKHSSDFYLDDGDGVKGLVTLATLPRGWVHMQPSAAVAGRAGVSDSGRVDDGGAASQ
eukprot:6172976-Pleurochrysis_carterae.AAC.1